MPLSWQSFGNGARRSPPRTLISRTCGGTFTQTTSRIALAKRPRHGSPGHSWQNLRMTLAQFGTRWLRTMLSADPQPMPNVHTKWWNSSQKRTHRNNFKYTCALHSMTIIWRNKITLLIDRSDFTSFICSPSKFQLIRIISVSGHCTKFV